MGRVGRYKKVKACDPFAKRRPEKKLRRAYDLPPDEDQTGPLKTGHALRRQERRWAREALGDVSYESLLSDSGKAPAAKVTIDPRRANETQKGFERRLKDDSMQLLKDHADKHSSTKAKRKAYLKGKEAKKKEAKKAPASREDDEAIPGFALRGTAPRFGERADAPPDFSVDVGAAVGGRPQKRKHGDRRDERAGGAKTSKKALKAARERLSATLSAAGGLASWERT